MHSIKASIITIGDELLIGQVIDTNSAYIAQSLNKIGVTVNNRIAVGDDKQAILNTLETTSKQSNIIIITGGLGPTADDITKPLLNEYFGGKLVIHQPSLDHITDIFVNKYKRPLIDRNIKQAEVPDVCEVLFNENGTAPGMLFEKEGVLYFSMPGVPHEMKGLVEKFVISKIQKSFGKECE
jgi:nicotinamide-nucleotide amidase